MSSESTSESANAPSQVPVLEVPPPVDAAPSPRAGELMSRGVDYLFLAVSALALAASVMLWQKLSNIQEQLARQSADNGNTAIEARTLAKQAQELARETAARQVPGD